MVKAVDHDTSSALASAGKGAGKGAALGFLASVAVFSLLGVGAAVAIGAAAGAIPATAGYFGLASAAEGMSAVLGGGGTALSVIGGIIGAGIGVANGALLTGIGGLLGAIKGGEKANLQTAAHAREAARVAGTRHKAVTKAISDAEVKGFIEGAQQVGQIAYRKGQEDLIQQLQEHAAAMVAAETAGAAPAAGTTQTAVPASAQTAALAPATSAGLAGAGVMTITSENGAGAASGAIATRPDGTPTALAAAICHCENPVVSKAAMIDKQRADAEQSVAEPHR